MAILCLAPIAPASASDRALCRKDAIDAAAIAACSRIVSDPSVKVQSKARAYFHRGNAYAANSDKERALADYDAAIRLDPTLADAYYRRASAQTVRERALADYDEAIRLNPRSSDFYFMRGTVHLQNNDHDRAIADFGQSARLDPGQLMAYAKRGEAHVAKHQYDHAIADYTHVLRRAPGFEAAYRRRAYAYVQRGLAHTGNGNSSAAIADFGKAINDDPGLLDAYLHRGDAQFDKKALARALADYDEAIRRDPMFVAAYNNRGFAYSAKGDHARAIADFNVVTRLDPAYPYAYRHRGNAHLAIGNRAQAMADFNEAIRLDPKYAKAFRSRGGAYLANGDYAQALSDMETYVKLKPEDPEGIAVVRRLQKQLAAKPAPEAPLAPPPVKPGWIALVIGNASYRAQKELATPLNDAADMAKALTELGFQVERLADADADTMQRALTAFAATAKSATVAVVFFSGQSFTLGGESHLLATDVAFAADGTVLVGAVPLREAIGAVASHGRLGLVILDALPHPSMPGSSHPLAIPPLAGIRVKPRHFGSLVNIPNDILVIDAGQQRTGQSDESWHNSLFTQALLRRIATPDLGLGTLLALVGNDVARETFYSQQPVIYGTLGGADIMLNEKLTR